MVRSSVKMLYDILNTLWDPEVKSRASMNANMGRDDFNRYIEPLLGNMVLEVEFDERGSRRSGRFHRKNGVYYQLSDLGKKLCVDLRRLLNEENTKRLTYPEVMSLARGYFHNQSQDFNISSESLSR